MSTALRLPAVLTVLFKYASARQTARALYPRPSPASRFDAWREKRASNGLGYSAHRTRRYISRFEPAFDLFYETPDVFQEWRRLLEERDISGRQIHDVRLVAAITVHGLDEVLTFDTTHFSRFPAISVTHPTDITAS